MAGTSSIEGKRTDVTTEIRHVRDDDADAVHRILEAPHVVRGTMRLPFQSPDSVRERIRHVDGVIKLVAVCDGRVAGYGELVTYPQVPRHRHAGEVNFIGTHPDFRGHKVGRALMQALIDMADNWLQLSRLGLIVWTGNKPAIALYREFGFAVEGTMPQYVVIAGSYCDAHIMGRIRGMSGEASPFPFHA
jgi:putative acetyltransferase